MSRPKMINVLAVLVTSGYVAFVLLAPASVVKPVSLALLGAGLTGFAVVILQSVRLTRRSTDRDQPST